MLAADNTVVQKAKRWWEAFVWPFTFLLALIPLAGTLGNVYGPQLEPFPVGDVRIDQTRCDGLDLLVVTSYVKAAEARFREMTVMVEPFDALPHAVKWTYLGERDLGSRPALPKLQYGGPLRINQACGQAFSFHLWYHSRFGWWDLYKEFGPFGPFGIPPSVAQTPYPQQRMLQQ